jgi:hypothetical protein
VEWGEADGTRLDIRPGDWRVRYSASGMDAAHDQTLLDGEPPIDHYLLQVWLAAPASDRPEAIRAQRPDPGSASVEDIRARVNDWYGALPGRWARVVDRSCGTIS